MLAFTSAVAPWSAPTTRKAVPKSPAVAISRALDRSPIVEIGEVHQWAGEHRAVLDLLRRPAIQRRVDDVVVEFGNARFQGIMDRYIGGLSVAQARVRRAWEQTTQGDVWANPLYAGFFASVRQINMALPKQNRYRVLLGDPPIDLTRSLDRAQLDFWIMQRDPYFSSIIQRDVLARGRRALVIAGVGHVSRSSDGRPSLTNLLEGTARCDTDPESIKAGIDWCDDLQPGLARSVVVVLPGRTGTSAAADRLLKDWPIPSVAEVEGTSIGKLPLRRIVDFDEDAALQSAADDLLYLGRL